MNYFAKLESMTLLIPEVMAIIATSRIISTSTKSPMKQANAKQHTSLIFIAYSLSLREICEPAEWLIP